MAHDPNVFDDIDASGVDRCLRLLATARVAVTSVAITGLFSSCYLHLPNCSGAPPSYLSRKTRVIQPKSNKARGEGSSWCLSCKVFRPLPQSCLLAAMCSLAFTALKLIARHWKQMALPLLSIPRLLFSAHALAQGLPRGERSSSSTQCYASAESMARIKPLP